jgi:mannosyltransferase
VVVADRSWWRGGISLPSVALPLLVMPAGVLMLESEVLRPFYVDRYVLYAEAGAALLAGAGIYRVGRALASASGRRWVLGVVAAVACVAVLGAQLTPQQRVRTPGSRMFNYGGPSFLIARQSRPGDGILFINTFYRKARLGYPQDYRKVADLALAVPPERTGSFNGRNKSFAQIHPLMLTYRRIWVLGRIPSLKLSSRPIRQESRVLLAHFHEVLRHPFKGIIVTLWVRN